MVVSLKYAILNGDYDFFFIEALHRDWEFHQSQNVQFSMVIADFFKFKIEALHRDWETCQPQNAQFLMAVADFFYLKSTRFTVIKNFTGREMRNS